MANINKEYLDLQGLQTYDAALKEYIPAPDGTTIQVNDNNELELAVDVPTITYSNATLVIS